jgi:hypothetical protein
MLTLLVLYRRLPRVLRALVTIVLALVFIATIERIYKAVHPTDSRQMNVYPNSSPR